MWKKGRQERKKRRRRREERSKNKEREKKKKKREEKEEKEENVEEIREEEEKRGGEEGGTFSSSLSRGREWKETVGGEGGLYTGSAEQVKILAGWEEDGEEEKEEEEEEEWGGKEGVETEGTGAERKIKPLSRFFCLMFDKWRDTSLISFVRGGGSSKRSIKFRIISFFLKKKWIKKSKKKIILKRKKKREHVRFLLSLVSKLD